MLAFFVATTFALTPNASSLDAVRADFGFSQGVHDLDLESEKPAPRAQKCGECHREIYEQWRASRHRSSTTNALFRQGLAHEPRLRCVRCHAPLPEQTRLARQLFNAKERTFELERAPKDSLLHEGITCAVCHVRNDSVLAARANLSDDKAKAKVQNAHPTILKSALLQSAFCGSCHEFAFEKHEAGVQVLTDSLTQTTFSEWREEKASNPKLPSCVGCHMREGSHSFLGGHDEALLKRSLKVSVDEEGIEVRTVGVGHRFPTGDLFRHLVVEVDEGVGFRERARFGKRFDVEDLAGSPVKRMRSNSAIKPGEIKRVNILADQFRYRVRYVYTSDQNVKRGELTPGERQVTVAEGQVGQFLNP